MSAVLSANSPTNRRFTLAMCIAIAAIVFFGFSFTIFPDVIARARPAVLYVHVISAVAWLILLVVQAFFVRNRQVAVHRRLGVYGMWLGALAAVSSFATALVLRHENVVRHGAERMAERIAFLAIPLNGFLIFSIFFGLAMFYRTRPALHRRFILVAAAALTSPALARLPFAWAEYAPSIVPSGLILILCIHDYMQTRRVHPASLAGLSAVIALQGLATYLFSSRPEWWVATAGFLIGV